MSPPTLFLTAEWRNLAMLNYEVDPVLLTKFVPIGTELDCWNGKTFISLVGFQFLRTRVCGIPIPFHRNFDEVNLRFYVRRSVDGKIRRGVVFIKEIVPRWAMAAVARGLYNERYVALPMDHQIKAGESDLLVEYGWRSGMAWNRIFISAAGGPTLPKHGSEEEFITEHFWGYSVQTDNTTVEYRVAHPSWRVWTGCDVGFVGDGTELYGPELASVLAGAPASAFLAEGSVIEVFRGQRI
jgi:uncharacterized protein YqjF (DUF2071 family)